MTLSVPGGSGTLAALGGNGLGVVVGGTPTALTLTGTPAEINAYLADAGFGVTYNPLANSSADVTLTVTTEDNGFTGVDPNGGFGEESDTDLVTLDLLAVNDAPVTDLNGGTAGDDATATFTEDGGAIVIGTAAATITDINSTNLTSMTVTLTNRPDGDGLESLLLNAAATTAAAGAGLTVGYTAATGVLLITGSATLATYQTILRGVQYNNTDQAPTAGARTINVVVNDGTTPSLVNTSTVTVNALNDAPVTDLNGGAGGDDTTATFTEDGGAVVIGTAAATITDVDLANLASMTITLTSRPDGNALESLSLNAAATTAAAGLTVGYTAATGVLLISGPASVATYQTILQGVQYNNTDQAPTAGTRTINVVVNDGTASSAVNTSTVTVVPANDAPTSTDDNFTMNEDTIRILARSDFGTFADVDGNSIAAVKITALETNGSLEFDTTGGGAWAAVTINQEITAAHITAGRLRFVPDANEFGTPYATVGYQVGDGTTFSAAAYTLTINVTDVPENATPVGFADNVFLNGPSGVSVVLQNSWLLANDTDADLDTLTVKSAADGTNADVTAVGATTTTFTYNGGTSSTGSFTYVATDGIADTASTTVNITRGGDNATITGGAGNDILIDTRGSESTTLNGGGGSDFIVAGAGDDTIVGAANDTLLDGGSGNDSLQVGANFNDVSNAQIANIENVTLTAAGLTLNLGDQTEGFTITGSAGVNSITGGGGADTIVGAANDTLLDGGTGADTLNVGATFNDTGDGQIVNIETVTLTASGLTLTLDAQTEGFTVNGSTGVDTITTGSGNDVINSNGGSDTINTGTGLDVVNLTGATTATSWTVNLGSDAVQDKVVFTHADLGTGHNTIATVSNFNVANDEIAVTLGAAAIADGTFLTVTGTQTNISAGVEVIELVNAAWVGSLTADGDSGTIEGFIAAATDDIPTGNYTFIVYSDTTGTANAGIYSVNISDDTNPTAGSDMVVEHIMTLNGVGYGNLGDANFVATADPLILDLGAAGIELTGLGDGVSFDINADGLPDQMAWTVGEDGILALDVDGNGTIDSGAEIFSPDFAGGGHAGSLAALATLDENDDGLIDTRRQRLRQPEGLAGPRPRRRQRRRRADRPRGPRHHRHQSRRHGGRRLYQRPADPVRRHLHLRRRLDRQLRRSRVRHRARQPPHAVRRLPGLRRHRRKLRHRRGPRAHDHRGLRPRRQPRSLCAAGRQLPGWRQRRRLHPARTERRRYQGAGRCQRPDRRRELRGRGGARRLRHQQRRHRARDIREPDPAVERVSARRRQNAKEGPAGPSFLVGWADRLPPQPLPGFSFFGRRSVAARAPLPALGTGARTVATGAAYAVSLGFTPPSLTVTAPAAPLGLALHIAEHDAGTARHGVGIATGIALQADMGDRVGDVGPDLGRRTGASGDRTRSPPTAAHP